MAEEKTRIESDELAAMVIHGIQEVKGENIIQLDLREVEGSVTDYFIICEAVSSTQIGAIKDSIQTVSYTHLTLPTIYSV